MPGNIYRLQKTKEIERVLKKGARTKEGFLILKTIKGNSGKTRFGFIVSCKVSKKAIVRNKIRRRLRALARRENGEGQPPRDSLLIALPGIETKNFKEIEAMVKSLFGKAKIS